MQSNMKREDSNNNGLNSNSRESSDFPLIVNCAGKLDINKPFLTYNVIGRLDYYLLYVTKGKLKVKIDNEIKVMSQGDFVIFPPKYKYWYEFEGVSSLSYVYIHFTGSHVEEYLNSLKLSANPEIYHARYGEEISLTFSNFFIDYESTQEFKGVALSVEFSRMLVLLAKEFHFGSSAHTVSRSLSYINENYAKEIRIPDLASLEGLSVSRYNFLFKKCVGVSPVRYITNLRMRQACILLDGTNLSVKQIAEMVGYADNHFFSKHFKSYLGISPISYRKSGKKA